MARLSIALLLLTALVGCGGKALTIDAATERGFMKERMQLFSMIGAQDGWQGTWAGETVELYEFKDADSVNERFFQSASASGNPSGWVDHCINKNLAMVSNGKNACKELKKL